jgi:hypothetical protein
VRQRGANARETARPLKVVRGKRGDHGEWPNPRSHVARQIAKRRARLAGQELARRRVAAVGSTVRQRPERPRTFRICRFAAEQPRSNPEQNAPTVAQSLGLRMTPREGVEEGKPRVFELSQLRPTDAAPDQLTRDRTKPRLPRRWLAAIQFLQALTPPGEPNRAECRLGRRRDNVSEREI